MMLSEKISKAESTQEEQMKAAQLFDVSGLATIVTGAASGIGLAYAEVMADNGARVTLLDKDSQSLDAATRKLAERGGEVRGQTLDVTDRAAVRASVDTAADYYGRLDVVFANVGIDSPPGFLGMTGDRNPDGAFENVSDERWDLVMATNLTSIFSTIKASVPHMKKNAKGGRIIVTTSVAAIRSEAIVGMPYMPAKAGAAHLVRQAALELAKYNILVNAIAPGPFVTNIAGGHMRDPTTVEAFARFSPLGRLASTDEIQGLALYLASPAATYVTGSQIVIDGGVLLGLAD
jgi:NAD(P)-dependent dehydrogenase (short-subunit alcohol dehydrogenase family)